MRLFVGEEGFLSDAAIYSDRGGCLFLFAHSFGFAFLVRWRSQTASEFAREARGNINLEITGGLDTSSSGRKQISQPTFLSFLAVCSSPQGALDLEQTRRRFSIMHLRPFIYLRYLEDRTPTLQADLSDRKKWILAKSFPRATSVLSPPP